MKRFYFLGLCLLISISSICQNFPFKSYYNHKDKVNAITFSPDSKMIASGGSDDALIIQETISRKALLTIKEHYEPVNHVSFNSQGTRLFAASNKVISVTDVENMSFIQKFLSFQNIIAFKASRNSDVLFFIGMGKADTNHKLFKFDWETGNFNIISDQKNLSDFDLSADGKYIYLAYGKIIERINLEDDSDRKQYPGHTSNVKSIAINGAGTKLVSTDGVQVMVRDAENGTYKGYGYKKSEKVAWSRNGEYFITYVKNQLFLREPESAKEQPMFTGSNAINTLEVSPNGGMIALAASSTKIQMFDNPWATEDEKLEVESKSSLLSKSPENNTQTENTVSTNQPNNSNTGTGLEGLTAAELEVLNRLREKRKKDVISEVDKNIPNSGTKNQYRFALIVGNEDYSTYQTDLTSEVDVDFAAKDANIFKEYANKTLGIPNDNIQLLTNATAGQMRQALSKLNKIIELTSGKAEVYFYYAGHGLPDEVTKEAYLIPVDVAGTNVQYGIKVNDVYKSLSEHPSEKITVFLDACFSGGARNQGLLAARGVKIKPKEEPLSGKLVVFSASSGDQSSLPYKSKGHGIFTYYLLKKLQESKGNITYEELSNYIKEKVSLQSVVINSKQQDPQTNVSPSAISEWSTWRLN